MRTKHNENLLRDVAHSLKWFKNHKEFGDDISVKHRKFFNCLNESIDDLVKVVDMPEMAHF